MKHLITGKLLWYKLNNTLHSAVKQYCGTSFAGQTTTHPQSCGSSTIHNKMKIQLTFTSSNRIEEKSVSVILTVAWMLVPDGLQTLRWMGGNSRRQLRISLLSARNKNLRWSCCGLEKDQVNFFLSASLGESLPKIPASDSCSWLESVEPNVVMFFSCCSPFTSMLRYFCVHHSYK